MPVAVNGYSLQGYQRWCHDSPRSWRFEGSDGGADGSWTTLDTKSGVAQDCAVQTGVSIALASYRFYRISVTEAGTGGGKPAGIAEAQICGPPGQGQPIGPAVQSPDGSTCTSWQHMWRQDTGLITLPGPDDGEIYSVTKVCVGRGTMVLLCTIAMNDS